MVSTIVLIGYEPVFTEAVLSQKIKGGSRQTDSDGRFLGEGPKHNEPWRRTQEDARWSKVGGARQAEGKASRQVL